MKFYRKINIARNQEQRNVKLVKAIFKRSRSEVNIEGDVPTPRITKR